MSNAVEVRISAAVGEAQKALADLARSVQQSARDMGAGMAPANEAMRASDAAHKGLIGTIKEFRKEQVAQGRIARFYAGELASVIPVTDDVKRGLQSVLGVGAEALMGGLGIGLAIEGVKLVAEGIGHIAAKAAEAKARTWAWLDQVKKDADEAAKNLGKLADQIDRITPAARARAEADALRAQVDVLDSKVNWARAVLDAAKSVAVTNPMDASKFTPKATGPSIRDIQQARDIMKEIAPRAEEAAQAWAKLAANANMMSAAESTARGLENSNKARDEANAARDKSEKDAVQRSKELREQDDRNIVENITEQQKERAQALATENAIIEAAAAQRSAEERARAVADNAWWLEQETARIDRYLAYKAEEDAALARSGQKWMTFAQTASNAMSHSFVSIFTGAKSLQDGLVGIFEGIADAFAQMIEQMIAKLIMSGILSFLGTLIGGPVGGFLGNQAGSLIGGKRAEGGSVTAGIPYLVGKKGPELRVFDAPGSIVPNSALGGAGTTIHMTLNTVDGPSVLRMIRNNGTEFATGIGELVRARRI